MATINTTEFLNAIQNVERQEFHFSSSEEIKTFNHGDDTHIITGYVTMVNSLKKVNYRNKTTLLFSVIINNNDSENIRVKFWGKVTLKYAEKIKIHQVLDVIFPSIQVKTSPTGKPYIDANIKRFTQVAIKGTFVPFSLEELDSDDDDSEIK